MKHELNLLKRAETNRRRKAQKDQELDKDRHATIEKLLKGSGRKTSDILLNDHQSIISEKESRQQRREELKRRQRESDTPMIRYCSSSNATTLSFPAEAIITKFSMVSTSSNFLMSFIYHHLSSGKKSIF
jgi:hypothetical protein